MLSLISLPVNFCSVPMASRRSKDKTPAAADLIVKNELVSSLDIVNRFTPQVLFLSLIIPLFQPHHMILMLQPLFTNLFKLFTLMLPNMLKNNLSKTCFPQSQIGPPLLTLLGLLLVIFLQNFTGFRNTAKRLSNIILKCFDMRIQSLSKP